MGGQLLAAPQRDDIGWAMKASAVCVDNKWIPISKSPATDTFKKSKEGRVTLYRDRNGKYFSGVEDWESPVLIEVFRDGKLLVDWSFQEVRDRASEIIE